MKHTLTIEFDDSPEDSESLHNILKADAYARLINDIRNELFRPARKHGYADSRLQDLSDSNRNIIGILEDKFNLLISEALNNPYNYLSL